MHPGDEPTLLSFAHLAVRVGFCLGAHVEDKTYDEVGVAEHTASQGEIIRQDWLELRVVEQGDFSTE